MTSMKGPDDEYNRRRERGTRILIYILLIFVAVDPIYFHMIVPALSAEVAARESVAGCVFFGIFMAISLALLIRSDYGRRR